ncbi:hypothetical protein M426DRAFT_32148, partial [Hypoxylon sp. CI-4A]
KPCEACLDDIPISKLAFTPCKHKLCQKCIRKVFEIACQTEATFPPSCCNRVIPLRENVEYLTEGLCNLYEDKALEYNTPVEERIYCFDSKCGVFIPSDRYYNGYAICPRCWCHTCLKCKAIRHADECKNDDGVEALNKLAEEKKWRRCDKCQTMIELRSGCFHMTCVCRHEFCYKCGAAWRSCGCENWEEANLIER